MKTSVHSQALLTKDRRKLTSRRTRIQKLSVMRKKVTLMLKRMSTEELIAAAVNIVSKMTGNSFFSAPSPALSAITSAATALQTAYDNAQGGGPAQTAVMHQKREALEILLTALGHYVEDRANDPANAVVGSVAVILSSGMGVKHICPSQKHVFEAMPGKTQGSVILVAAAVKRGTHEWQYAADLNNPGWVAVDSTIKATTVISGLVRFKTYYFRHRVLLKDGYTEWDAPVELLVI